MKGPESALLVVDIQNDFLPGGALAVEGGDQIIPLINQLMRCFDSVILTQDWHPADHISFANQHRGAQALDVLALPYGEQVFWPAHCIQGSDGAALASALQEQQAELILQKGCQRDMDSYSAFIEADRKTETGLATYLRKQGVTVLYICGLATDYCVKWTALDACAMGFKTAVIEDACRGVDQGGALTAAWRRMQSAGVQRVSSRTILEQKNSLPSYARQAVKYCVSGQMTVLTPTPK